MKRKFLIRVLSFAFTLMSTFVISSCYVSGFDDLSSSSSSSNSTSLDSSSPEEEGEQTQIEKIYAQYVVYTESAGEVPLSYEDWLATIKGEKGEQGDKGDKGETGAQGVSIVRVEIDENGDVYVIFSDNTKQKVELSTPSHQHTFSEWTPISTTANVSCAERILLRVCSTCNAVEGKQGGHNWQTEYTSDSTHHWFKCSDCEEIQDKAIHAPIANGICTVCERPVDCGEYHVLNNQQMIPRADGKIYTAATTAGVKEFAGRKATSCLPEGYGAGYFMCEACGDHVEVITYTAHNFSNTNCKVEIKEEAYCSKDGLHDGLKWVYCAYGCGEYNQVVIPAPAHEYEYEIIKNSDETLKVKVMCQNCEDVQLLEGVTEKEKVEASCQQAGYVIYSAMVDGKEITTDKFILPATTHYVVFNNEKIYMNEEKYDITKCAGYIKEFAGKKADCDPENAKEGSGYFACESCGEIYEVTTFKSHTYDLSKSTIEEATCTTPEYTTGKCVYCNTDSTREVSAPPLGHKPSAELVKYSWSGSSISVEYSCSACKEVIENKTYDTNAVGTWTVNERCIKEWHYDFTYNGVTITVVAESGSAHAITIDGRQEIINSTTPYDIDKYAAYIKEFAGKKATGCTPEGYGSGYFTCSMCQEYIVVITCKHTHEGPHED